MPFECTGAESLTESASSNGQNQQVFRANSVRIFPISPRATSSDLVKQENMGLVQALLASLHCSTSSGAMGYLNTDGAVYRSDSTVIFAIPAGDDHSKLSNSIFRLSSRAFAASMCLPAYRLIRGKRVEVLPLALTQSVVREASISPFFPLQYDFLLVRLNDLVFDKNRLLYPIPCIAPLKTQLSMLPLINDPSCQFSIGYPALVTELTCLESLSCDSARKTVSLQSFLKKIKPNDN